MPTKLYDAETVPTVIPGRSPVAMPSGIRATADMFGLGAAQAMGQGAAQAAQGIQEAIGEIYTQKVRSQMAKKKVEALGRFSEFEDGLLGRNDYETYMEEHQAVADGLREEFSQTITDKVAWAEMEAFLALQTANSKSRVRGEVFKQHKISVNADIIEAANQFKSIIARPNSDKATAFATLHSALNDAEAALGRDEVTKLRIAAEEELVRQQVWEVAKAAPTPEEAIEYLESNPEAGLTMADGRTLIKPRHLDRETLRSMSYQIRSEWANLKTMEKERQEEAWEETRGGLIKSYAKGDITFDAIMQADLPEKEKIWWENVMEARDKRILEGKEDPYRKTTNWKAYADMSRKIALSPDAVETADIHALMTEGVGIGEIERLVGLHAQYSPDGKVTAEQKKTREEIYQVMDRMRQNGLFVEELAPGDDITDRDTWKQNEAGYLRMFEEVTRYMEEEDDPQLWRDHLEKYLQPVKERGAWSRFGSWLKATFGDAFGEGLTLEGDVAAGKAGTGVDYEGKALEVLRERGKKDTPENRRKIVEWLKAQEK